MCGQSLGIMTLPRANNEMQLVYSIVCNFNGIVLFKSSDLCVNVKVHYFEQDQGVNLKKLIQKHHSQQKAHVNRTLFRYVY